MIRTLKKRRMMRDTRLKQEQIIAVFREAKAEVRISELYRKYSDSDATIYNWKAKYADLTVKEARRLKQLEQGGQPIEAHRSRPDTRDKGAQVCGIKKLLKPKAKRQAGGIIIDRSGLSIRRKCRYMGLSSTSFSYQPVVRSDEEVIRRRLKRLEQTRRRFGCPRLHIMLRREGFMINHKRTERIYRKEGLSLHIRRRKKMSSLLKTQIPKLDYAHHIWSMDFMRDNLADGRTIKVLSVVDEYMRKCFGIKVNTSINDGHVARVFSEVALIEGLPEITVLDNNPKFISKSLDAWAYQRGLKLTFIRPSKLVENTYIESFNGRLRDERLNENCS